MLAWMTRAIATAAFALTAGLALAPQAGASADALASPKLTASASSGLVLGGAVNATATLSEGTQPTGTIAFRLYGPSDPACTQIPLFTSTATVSGNGAYASAPFMPTQAGAHRWIASYSGDAGNRAAQSGCGATGSAVTVPKARRALALVPSAGAVVGRSVRAIATLGEPAVGCPPVTRVPGWGCLRGPAAPASAGFIPAGTITFRLYGPDDPACARSPAFTDAIAVAQEGASTSAEFVPAQAGVYRWSATFSGDADNEAATAACDAGAPVTVAKATPALSVSSSPGVVGGSIRATGTLSGGHQAGGRIAFALYGPGDERCAGTPVFSSAVAAAGDGAYDSASFRPALAGTYRWVLSHAGDANNEPAATRCEDASAAVLVSPPPAESPPPAPPAPAPPAPAPPAPRPAPQPAIERFALASRCARPAANGSVRVVLLLRAAQAGAVRVRVERALGTGGRERCPARNGSGRFTGRFRTVATVREVRTQAAAAALARRVTLRLRLQPALYRITVRAFTSSGRLSPPKRRYLRVLTDTTGTR